jgi:hypothetical protein
MGVPVFPDLVPICATANPLRLAGMLARPDRYPFPEDALTHGV